MIAKCRPNRRMYSFAFSQTAVRTAEEDKSRLEGALAECRRLEERCYAKTAGGWMREVRRRLFSTAAAAAASADDYDRQIALADVTVCIAGLTLAAHRNSPSVGAMARAVYALRRAWKMYQQCYAAVLNVYRNAYDMDAGQRDECSFGVLLKVFRTFFSPFPAPPRNVFYSIASPTHRRII